MNGKFYSTKQIQVALCTYLSVKRHEHICENYGHTVFEMDVASLSKSDMLLEFEIKITRSDFLSDRKKGIKEIGLPKFDMYANPLGRESQCPNYFYYVCPENLISEEEVPPFAGLFYYIDRKVVLIKSPKRIHKIPSERVQILNKMLRMVSQRIYLGGTMLTYKNNQVKEKNKQYYDKSIII